MKMERSAGAVIFRRSGDTALFLLLRYPAGHWDLVKGKMEGCETAEEAAVREASEETGISDLRFADGFAEEIQYTFRSGGADIHKRVIFFLAETQTSAIRLSDEHQDYLWLEYDRAVSRLTYDNARQVMSRACNAVANLSR